MLRPLGSSVFFFFNDTATTEIYTLSLHDALPISLATASRGAPSYQGRCRRRNRDASRRPLDRGSPRALCGPDRGDPGRSEEHTSELQSHSDLVCRLLLEKKKNT